METDNSLRTMVISVPGAAQLQGLMFLCRAKQPYLGKIPALYFTSKPDHGCDLQLMPGAILVGAVSMRGVQSFTGPG